MDQEKVRGGEFHESYSVNGLGHHGVYGVQSSVSPGGFGVGSDFTWQLFGGYSFDFSVMQTTLHGLVGYRALSIDYTQDGPSKNNLDLVLHGPVAGLSFRW